MNYNFFQRLFGVDKSNQKTDELINRIESFEKKLNKGNSGELITELTSKIIELQKSVSNQNTETENSIFSKEDFAFNMPDPLNFNTNLFSFEIEEKNTTKSKKKINGNVDSFLRNLGSSIPEIASNGMLSNSYRFVFPQGVSGAIMKLPLGQGTAITNKAGTIIKHGAYVSNMVVAAPLIVINIGTMIIRQHYLAKINKNLEEIKADVKKLLELVFIDKEAKIESIIAFSTKAHVEFNLIENNKEYRNAYLTNIVRTNNEILELIFFYGKSLKTKDKDSEKDIKKHLNYYLALHTIYIQGKLLEFKYANEYNDVLLSNLKETFNNISSESLDILKNSQMDIYHDILKIKENRKFLDAITFNKIKSSKIETLTTCKDVIIEVMNIQRENFQSVNGIIEDFQTQLKQPKTFLIEDGELFEVIE